MVQEQNKNLSIKNNFFDSDVLFYIFSKDFVYFSLLFHERKCVLNWIFQLLQLLTHNYINGYKNSINIRLISLYQLLRLLNMELGSIESL